MDNRKKKPEQVLTQWETAERYFIENSVSEFVLYSLNDAPRLSIFKGDLIVLDTENSPADGALVVAKGKRFITAYSFSKNVDESLESAYTVQFFKKDGSRTYSIPLDKAIIPNFAVISFVLTGKELAK